MNKAEHSVLMQPRSEQDHKNVLEQGFTLVELLIVIVILGILAGIVVFAVGSLTGTSANNACGTEAKTFETAAAAYNAQRAGNPALAVLSGTVGNTGNPTGTGAAGQLQAQGLISPSSTLKYAGAASGPSWAWNGTTVTLTGGCAS